MKKITVAIPTYNREKYLIESLTSILNQTEKNIDILVFDNGSDYDIYGAIKKIDPENKIKIIRSEKNLGGTANFQRIKDYNFDSEYLIVFHDDDVMHKDYLKSALSFLEKNKEVIWLGSNINFVKNSERIFDFKKVNYNNFEKITTSKLVTLLLTGYNLGYCSIIYKTKPYQKGQNFIEFDKKFGKWGDRPIFIELSKQGPVAITKEKFINYRVHSGQDSQNYPFKGIPKEAYNLLEYYSEELDGAGFEKPNKYMTIQSIISATGSAQNFSQLFILLNIYKEKGWFSYKKISLRGYYYFIKFLIKIIKKL